MNPAFWRGKRVFLTGHTGFKGSWLALWLHSMGAAVKGYALAPPTSPALFQVAQIGADIESEIADIRDLATLAVSMSAFKPEVLIHMAAQPLVRLSYREPVETYATNVMGTVHVLEAARQCPHLRAIVNVTTDKCYENHEWPWGYREHEALGGNDPYSSSKGCSELVSAAYRLSFFCAPHAAALATARSGNVVGGGDWAAERLVPDILRAFERQQAVVLRNPNATRPWQHVLEPLSGYLTLAEHLCAEGHACAESWNFGPRDDDAQPVQWIVERMASAWGHGAQWQPDAGTHPHEAQCLKLDISKAKARLGWQPRWPLALALQKTVEWHQAYLGGADMRAYTLQQIQAYQQAHCAPATRPP